MTIHARIAARGFTMIEMCIVFVIVAIIAALGVPSLTRMIDDSRIRAMTDQYRDGLALARAEAIQRNRAIRFDVISTGWQVVLPPAGVGTDTVLQQKSSLTTEGRFPVTASAASMFFTSAGRPTVGNYTINIAQTGGTCVAAGGAVRCLRVVVTPGGSVRTCDPAVGVGDPRSCA